MSDWLTVKEVQQEAKCGQKLVYREVQAGRLRAARLGGRKGPLRIHRTWITEWLERCATPIEIGRR